MDNYLEDIFKNNIDKNKVKIVFELGSRDLIDSIKLQKYFNCKVYSFECNPDCLTICKTNYNKLNEITKQSIKLIDFAVSTVDGYIKFYPFDLNKYNNMGASSCLKIDFSNRCKWDADYNRPNPQKEIIVPSVRLDTILTSYKINNIDLLCMDLQEYELVALYSLGDHIKNVKYIITEATINSTYQGGVNFTELYDYLKKYNFVYICSDEFKYDLPNNNIIGYFYFNVLFMNKNI